MMSYLAGYRAIRCIGLILLTAFFTQAHAQQPIVRNTQPCWSPDGKQIVFTSLRDGQREIYVMNSDGTHQVNITNHPAEDSEPQWSPDGLKILFISNRTGIGRIFTMKPDGSDVMELTHTGALELTPVWSPSGKRIAYASTYQKNTLLYTTNADGSNSEQLTISRGNLSKPIWSADESQIACTVAGPGVFGSLIIDLATNTSAPVLAKDGPVHHLGWSKGGERSFFIDWWIDTDGKRLGKIYYTDSTGKITVLAKRIPELSHVEISPDGNRVLYMTYNTVCVTDPGKKKSVEVGTWYHSAKWSPDGQTIVMASKNEVNIFTVKPDGTGLTQLTH